MEPWLSREGVELLSTLPFALCTAFLGKIHGLGQPNHPIPSCMQGLQLCFIRCEENLGLRGRGLELAAVAKACRGRQDAFFCSCLDPRAFLPRCLHGAVPSPPSPQGEEGHLAS